MTMKAKNEEIDPEYYENFIWLDGQLIKGKDCSLSLMTHTLHYGLGAFEGIRAYKCSKGSVVVHLKNHIVRLLESAKMLRMEVPFTAEELEKACVQVLQANNFEEAYLRPIIFMDDGKRGLAAMNNRIRVGIVTWPWGAYLGAEGLEKGISLQISSWRRMNSASFLPKGKICGQYVNGMMAKRDALLSGYDEALMLDEHSYVAEASGENFFMIKDGKILTPPKSSPILAGITRQSLIEIAQLEGYLVEERGIAREEVFTADEIFLTGTAAEVTPVASVDKRFVGIGKRGEITEKLQGIYMSMVRGQSPRFENWLTRYEIS